MCWGGVSYPLSSTGVGGAATLPPHFLGRGNMKKCGRCRETKSFEEFGRNKSRSDGLSPNCKECRRTYNYQWNAENRSKVLKAKQNWFEKNRHRYKQYFQKRKNSERKATPPWYEEERVANVYQKAVEFGMEVDHIVPLNSDQVCGLHCWANLQLLNPEDNRSKGNRFWPDMP